MKALQGNFLLTATIKFKANSSHLFYPSERTDARFLWKDFSSLSLLYASQFTHTRCTLIAPYNLAHSGKIVQEEKKKRLAYEHELFTFQIYGTVALITQQGLWFYLSQGSTPHWTGCKSSSDPHLTLLLLSQLSIGKGSDKKIRVSPLQLFLTTNLSLKVFALMFLQAGLEHLEPCQMPSVASVATDAQQTGPWAGSHLH